MNSLKELIGPLDETNREALYKQLQRKLRDAIGDNGLSPDQLLPPERDIASEFGVSRITVRKALEGLVNEGLLSRRQGAGTFVSTRVEKNFSQLTSFSEDMAARGFRARSTWLERSLSDVTPQEVMNYGLSPGMKVYRLHRLRFADDQPMSVEYTLVPAHFLPSAKAVKSSLYDALGQGGHRPARALQRLRAILLDAERAKLLEAKENDAGLLVERRGFLKDGRIVEIARSYYRGDTYDFVAELNS